MIFLHEKKKLEKKSNHYFDAKFHFWWIEHGFRAIRTLLDRTAEETPKNQLILQSSYVYKSSLHMEVVRTLVPTGTLTKKIHHEIRDPKKSMQQLGLAVNTGIDRDPFSDPVLSIFLHFFWKKFVLVEGGKSQL